MEQSMVSCSDLTALFAGCRDTYTSYSDAADKNGYYAELEPGIVQTIETLEYIRNQANFLMSNMTPGEKTMGNGEYAMLISLTSNCTDYEKKMASLRERHKSLFTTVETTGIKDQINDLFGFLFTQDWFREYVTVSDIDTLIRNGIPHGFFHRGKQEKLMKKYMLTLSEIDIIIYGLLCIYTSDDMVLNINMDSNIQLAIEDVIASMNEAKNDPRLLKTIYNKYGKFFEYLLKKTGNYAKI